MKKRTAKKSPKKYSLFSVSLIQSKPVRWLGVDVHHIALGVSFVGCIVALLLVQKQKSFEQQQSVLAAQTGTAVPYVRVGGVVPSCIPRPPCLSAIPRCIIAEPDGGWCPSSSPRPAVSGIPNPTCIPRPWCIDHTPRCMMAEPAEGWCPPSDTPTPSPTPPQGCTYKQVCLMIMCSTNNPNCNRCHSVLVCPSGVLQPSVHPSCVPVPTCNPKLGILCRAFTPCNVSITPVPRVTCMIRPTCPAGKLCPQVMIACPQGGTPKITGSVPVGNQITGTSGVLTPSVISSFFNSFINKFISIF